MVNELGPKGLIQSGALEQVQLQQNNAETALLSIAVSLKRLADVFTSLDTDSSIVEKMAQDFFMYPINSYGEGIGQAIQGQMVRGQRGIDY